MTNEDLLAAFLKSSGYSVQLTDIPGYPDVKFAQIDHMGVSLGVSLVKDRLLVIETVFGHVPKLNVAPLFRRLLSLNRSMTMVKFSLSEKDNSLSLKTDRPIAGLDAAELKASLNHVGTYYWRYVPGLIQEFQLPTQPS